MFEDPTITQKRLATALKTRLQGLDTKKDTKPVLYEKPVYNTPAYWRDCLRGWISDEEQRMDYDRVEMRRKRAKDSKYNQTPAPTRHDRPAPIQTKQFSKPMATQAARDDRLTPNAKALLQVIVARTGKGRNTDTTKTTLSIIMNRCPRTIQRYVNELIKFDYIRTQTIRSRRSGLFTGLRIWIMNSVLPFYKTENKDYEPSQWFNIFDSRRNSEETETSPINDKHSFLNLLGDEKPPWFGEFAFR